MGVTVRQKEKGKGKPWWVFINHNYQRKSIKVGSKTAAEDMANKLREGLKFKEINLGPKKTVDTFGEFGRQWLDTHGEVNLKYSTLKGYQAILKIHLGPLADRPLDQITLAEIRELIFTKLKTGLAPATVTRIKALISGILSQAVEDEIIQSNPTARMGKLIKNKDQKKDVNALTRDEARAMLDVLKKHYRRHHPFFLCALLTGMRLGELLGLEWGDIDFRGGFIEVRRAHVKGHITTPKSGKSRRVDMGPQLAETFKTLRTERKKESLAKGWGEVPGRVFINEVGQVLDEGNLRRRVFYPTLVKAGIRHIRIHDLRHTYASMLIQNGESLAYVRDQLGHSSIQITVDIYGHLVPGDNKQAVARLADDILGTYCTAGRVQIGATGDTDMG
jgi:integrase